MPDEKFITEVTEDEVNLIQLLSNELSREVLDDYWNRHCDALAKLLNNMRKPCEPITQPSTPWPIVKFHRAAREMALSLRSVYKGLGIDAPENVRGPLESVLATDLNAVTFEDRDELEATIETLKARVEELEAAMASAAEDYENSATYLKGMLSRNHPRF
jgi:hypothetical protein